MTKSKNTKRAFLASVLSMMLCIVMLIGATFAWFTDSVTSGRNKIVAGNLDVELYHTNGNVSEEKVGTDTKLFVNKDGSDILWEPGVMVYENFTVKNAGTLALKYNLKMNVGDFNTVKDTEKSLKDVLKVAVLDGAFTGTREAAQGLTFDQTIADFEKEGNIAAKAADDTYAVVIYWEPSEVDNEYNLNNGKESSDKTPLHIDLGVNLVATQDTVEKDSFDEQYDKNAWFDLNATDNENGTYTNDGQLYVKDDNNYVAVTENQDIPGLYEAENGNKYVASVDAFEAVAPQGGNVTVLDNIEKVITSTAYFQDSFLNVTATDAPVNIDLSNKAISIESATGKNGIKVSEGASATFSNGTITMNKAYGSGSPVVDAYHAEITLDNMTVTNSMKDGVCVSAGSDGGKVVIKSSVVTGGGQYSPAVFCGSGSTVVIEGGKIIGHISAQVNAKIELRGGDYTQAVLYGQNSSNIIVYSGTFSQNPKTYKNGCTIASGSTLTENADGTWTVTAG